MSQAAPAVDMAATPMGSVSRKEWLHLRAYWRQRDGKAKAKDSSAGRRHRNAHPLGRPRSKERRKRWQVWLSMSEINLWKRLAKADGMTPAQWLKSKLRSGL